MKMKDQLQQVLNNEIPLTNAIGIKVENISNSMVCLKAPLDKNTNHKSTAFGGSLYSLSVLTGWSLVYVILKRFDINAHIVIQHSEIDYLYPVKNDFVACSEEVTETKINKFIKVYKRKGRARIMLDVKIMNGLERAVHFSGDYVIHK